MKYKKITAITTASWMAIALLVNSLPAFAEVETPAITISGDATFQQGADSSVNFTINPSGTWDWSEGGEIDFDGFGVLDGLSNQKINQRKPEEIPSFRIYGTPNLPPGQYPIEVTLLDDFTNEATVKLVVVVTAATTGDTEPDTESVTESVTEPVTELSIEKAELAQTGGELFFPLGLGLGILTLGLWTVFVSKGRTKLKNTH